MVEIKTTVGSLAFVFSSLLASCSGCGDNNAVADSGTDTGLDTDTSWDGGPMTDCEGAAPGENMVCVKGGKYLLGCMPYDLQCKDNEKPMVEVTLSPFWIDEKEATIEELLPFLNSLHEGYLRGPNWIYKGTEETGLEEVLWQSFSSGITPVCLNEEIDEYEYSSECSGEYTCDTRSEDAVAGGLGWLAAKMYCEFRGKRLPTETEWEAAARGQTKWIYPCAWEHKACWYGKYGCCGAEYEAECPGGCSAPCCIPFDDDYAGDCESPAGTRGMYGNAAEWVLDHEDSNHSWCSAGCTDPAPRSGEVAILKGGSIAWSAEWTRISARAVKNDNTPINFAGVRCVSSPIDFVLSDGGVVWGE